jgi:hypothetical protein
MGIQNIQFEHAVETSEAQCVGEGTPTLKRYDEYCKTRRLEKHKLTDQKLRASTSSWTKSEDVAAKGHSHVRGEDDPQAAVFVSKWMEKETSARIVLVRSRSREGTYFIMP